MKWNVFTCLILGAAVMLPGQPPRRRPAGPPQQGPQQALAPEDYGRIEGIVTHAQTGEPIRKAEVQLMAPGSPDGGGQVYQTMDDGRFVFTGVRPGPVMLRVSRTGFIRQRGGGGAAGGNGGAYSLNLTRGQTLSGIQFKMLPQGVITGRVLDEEGDPAPRAGVHAYRYTYPGGRKTLASAGSAESNDQGEFRIWDLPPGTYYLCAMPRESFGAGMRPLNKGESQTPTFFPSAESVERSTPVTVTAGSLAANMDIRLRRARLYTISGTVVDAGTGQPAGRVSVGLTGGLVDLATWGRATNMMTRDGTFTIPGLPPGSYTIEAQVYGNSGGSSFGSARVELGNEDVRGIQIAVKPNESIQGVVKYEGADPPATKHVRVMLDSLLMTWAGGSAGGVADAESKFTIANVPAGKYRVRVSGIPAGFYVRNVMLRSQDLKKSVLDLSMGAAAAGDLEIVLAAGAGSIEGLVKAEGKDEGLENATVVLFPKEEWMGVADPVRSTSSGNGGEFRFAGLAPGEYEVYAFEDIENGAWEDPEVRERAREGARKVRVEKGSTERVEVRLGR